VKPSAEDRELRWNTGHTSVREAGLVPTLGKLWSEALKVGSIGMAVFADRIAPYSYDESVPGSRKKPPSVRFWMGTDNIGRDKWSRVMYGCPDLGDDRVRHGRAGDCLRRGHHFKLDSSKNG
jgi:ABC-type dipeptide/oligopeptide/nickel transport system permease subunit